MSEEQLEWISDSTERAAKRALRRYVRRSAAGFVVVIVGLAFAGNAYLHELEHGLTRTCERVNLLRAQSNTSDAVSFQILSISAQREAKLAKTEPINRKTHKQSADVLAQQALNLTVTGFTDCEQAVGAPDSYAQPIANPIGEPTTGKLNTGVSTILRRSHALLEAERRRREHFEEGHHVG